MQASEIYSRKKEPRSGCWLPAACGRNPKSGQTALKCSKIVFDIIWQHTPRSRSIGIRVCLGWLSTHLAVGICLLSGQWPSAKTICCSAAALASGPGPVSAAVNLIYLNGQRVILEQSMASLVLRLGPGLNCYLCLYFWLCTALAG